MTAKSLLQDIEDAGPDAPDEPSAVERRILKHAIRSFGRRGYAATTLRAIARDANVTAPLVSYYFKSKENLFVRVTEIVMESLRVEVVAALEAPVSFYDAVVGVVQAHIGLGERSPAAVEFMFAMLYGPQEGQPLPDLTGMWEDVRARMQRVFDDGIAAGELKPRPGVTSSFLVQQLGNLIHSQTTLRFKAARLIERFPDQREEILRRVEEMSLDIALEHFFFGAGGVPELETRTS